MTPDEHMAAARARGKAIYDQMMIKLRPRNGEDLSPERQAFLEKWANICAHNLDLQYVYGVHGAGEDAAALDDWDSRRDR